jgi:hypothetical protein
VFQGFSKAKSGNGGSILSSRQFLILPQLPQKNKAPFKSGQSRLKNNHFARYLRSLKLTLEKRPLFLRSILGFNLVVKNKLLRIIFFGLISEEVSFPSNCLMTQISKKIIYKMLKNEAISLPTFLNVLLSILPF